MSKNTTEGDQLLKFAKDLREIYNSEKKKRAELESAHDQLEKYAKALKETIRDLRMANEKLEAQVVLEEREKLLQKKLIHANKMTSLGTLASGITHEINNPVNYIQGNSQMLIDIWSEAEKVVSGFTGKADNLTFGGLSVEEISDVVPKMLKGNFEGCLRISNIIKGLKNYSRSEEIEDFKEFDVNKAIEFSYSILNNQIKKYTDNFNLTLAQSLPSAWGNPGQIEQVMINIIQNALLALPEPSSGIFVSSLYEKKSNELKIIIRDEGTGIDEKILNKITDPFFTTRRDEGGTGLGLYISYSIINQHHGKIDINSVKDIGTTITISIPVRGEKQ